MSVRTPNLSPQLSIANHWKQEREGHCIERHCNSREWAEHVRGYRTLDTSWWLGYESVHDPDSCIRTNYAKGYSDPFRAGFVGSICLFHVRKSKRSPSDCDHGGNEDYEKSGQDENVSSAK